MTDSAIERIENDTDWLPHRLDLQGGTVEFVRVPRQVLTSPGFLFEYSPSDPADRISVPLEYIEDIRTDSLPFHFIFHTAFCRSTLLARALNIEGVSLGLSEPGIIADLASAGPQARRLHAPILRLLAREREDASTVFIKPTNHANRILPDLLRAAPDAHAVLMTNPLASFLLSVRKRGLMGHRWGRKLYLEMQGYAGIDLGLPPEEVFAMSDLQTAGMAWLLNQRYFTHVASGSDSIRTLDGDYFNARRGETLSAILTFCEVEHRSVSGKTLADHVAFGTHSKLGGSYDDDTSSSTTAQEIEQVAQWLGLIAKQLRLTIPIAQSLL